jgi:HAD superfamily hydrolase (TIGR01490 family)
MSKAAFFDVDGTLLSGKSLIGFAQFLQTYTPMQIPTLPMFLQRLQIMFQQDMPRPEMNRYYFSIFKGQLEQAVDAAGLEWFMQEKTKSGFYVQSSLDKLRFLKEKNYRIVFVSGSFMPILSHLAREVGGDDVLCSRPEIIHGKYTGELCGSPCIGEAKKNRVLRYALDHHINLSECKAFGDDDSDIAMLKAVGEGVKIITGGGHA